MRRMLETRESQAARNAETRDDLDLGQVIGFTSRYKYIVATRNALTRYKEMTAMVRTVLRNELVETAHL